jgi:hypothetical protein
MMGTVKREVGTNVTPFCKMFFLMFGQTLGTFFCILLSTFFMFHVWLMLKAMTTIEFCEKQMKRSSYDSSVYDLGCAGNIRAVLGDNWMLWLLPCSLPSGDGLSFWSEESSLRLSPDMEVGRDMRRDIHTILRPSKTKGQGAGTGECASDSEGNSTGRSRQA